MKKKPGLLTLDHVSNSSLFREQFHLNYYRDNYPVSTVPHRHNFYEVLWFPHGEGIHCIDDTCFPVSGNDLFLISEGQVHYYKEVSQLEGFMLLFRDVFWEYALESLDALKTTLFNHLLINVHLQLPEDDATDITHLLGDFLKEFQCPDYPGKAEVMIAYLKILLIRISNLQRHAAGSSSNERTMDYKLFQEFIDLLEKNYISKRDVAFYASQLHVPHRRLASISHQFDRRSPKQLIDNRVMIAAKRLLQFNPMPVKEVAYLLNFSDQYQFSKFFRKHAAVSPVEFRTLMQNGK